MKYLQRLMLLLLITPILLMILVSALNYNKSTKVKLLTWISPKVSIGLLISFSYISGIIISSSTTKSLISTNVNYKRKVIVNSNNINMNEDYYEYDKDESLNSFSNEDYNEIQPERTLNDPPPTISVPYRIIKKKQDYTEKIKNVVSNPKDKVENRNPKNSKLNLDSNNIENKWGYLSEEW